MCMVCKRKLLTCVFLTGAQGLERKRLACIVKRTMNANGTLALQS